MPAMRRGLGFLVLILSWTTNVAGSIVEVKGRVVDEQGKPIAGAQVAENWFTEQSVPLEPNRPARTDADGQFSIEVQLYTRDTVVMAIDPTGNLGGLAVIPAKGPRQADPDRGWCLWLRCEAGSRARNQASLAGRDVHDDIPRPGNIRVAAGRSQCRDLRDEAAAGAVPASWGRKLSPHSRRAGRHARDGCRPSTSGRST